MVKAPAIGQRSMRAASCRASRDWLEVILKSGNFLNRKLARRNQLWLVRHQILQGNAACRTLPFDEWRAGRGVGIVNGDPTLERIARGNGLALCAAGSWTARFAPVLEQMVADAEKLGGSRPNIFIDVSQVSKLDTFGAWLIERLRRSLTQGERRGQDRRALGRIIRAWSTRCGG